MSMKAIATVLVGLLALNVTPARAADAWSYNHPEDWGNSYPKCKGEMQSPINIQRAEARIDPTLSALNLKYSPSDDAVVENHCTSVYLKPAPSAVNTFTPPGASETYNLAQLHFHFSSEHGVDGVYYPLEVHMVHQSPSGALAVLGSMYQLGEANTALQAILDKIYNNTADAVPYERSFDPAEFMSQEPAYFHYMGSLTTPPCTEGVRWFVFEKPLTVSIEQVEQIRRIVYVCSGFLIDARPVQRSFGRDVRVYLPESRQEMGSTSVNVNVIMPTTASVEGTNVAVDDKDSPNREGIIGGGIAIGAVISVLFSLALAFVISRRSSRRTVQQNRASAGVELPAVRAF